MPGAVALRRRTSRFCREFIDGTEANGLGAGETFDERAALLLATPLEGPASLPFGRGLVAVVALGEETFHRRRYLVGGGQVLAGGFGVAVVLLLELVQ